MYQYPRPLTPPPEPYPPVRWTPPSPPPLVELPHQDKSSHHLAFEDMIGITNIFSSRNITPSATRVSNPEAIDSFEQIFPTLLCSENMLAHVLFSCATILYVHSVLYDAESQRTKYKKLRKFKADLDRFEIDFSDLYESMEAQTQRFIAWEKEGQSDLNRTKALLDSYTAITQRSSRLKRRLTRLQQRFTALSQ
ncbi:hypothetical protein KEM48_006167 [Puccinia striiformis f. sp. tritici PST-130]|nr:hypothetical protein KEM48_006167 [Puccinia striiformis f. sp. tritici PST-130]